MYGTLAQPLGTSVWNFPPNIEALVRSRQTGLRSTLGAGSFDEGVTKRQIVVAVSNLRCGLPDRHTLSTFK